QRIDTRGRGAWREYAGFVSRVLRGTGRDVALFVGHDMHGLLPARLLATRYRRPLVYHCHDFTDSSRILPWGSRIVQKFEQRFARTADLVIVPDARRGEVVEKELRLKRAPLIVANAPLNRPLKDGNALHEAVGSQGREFERIVLRQGRIAEGHAIEATLRSIPQWASRNWGFVLLGVQDAAFVEHVRTLVNTLGVEQQFAMLPAVAYDRVLDYTPGADVGHALYDPVHINNVHITTASNKIMEYLAAGLPLLVSDTPSQRALVEAHRCGVTADERSPDSIAATVNSLLGQPERSREFGAAARRAFEQVFCYERQFAPALEGLRALAAGL
ncbi:MAG TPA: glycosyltransferase, partial [Armatimonadota bacterium]|nr:glycosyltransferase [Armatimonadota bacterium]